LGIQAGQSVAPLTSENMTKFDRGGSTYFLARATRSRSSTSFAECFLVLKPIRLCLLACFQRLIKEAKRRALLKFTAFFICFARKTLNIIRLPKLSPLDGWEFLSFVPQLFPLFLNCSYCSSMSATRKILAAASAVLGIGGLAAVSWSVVNPGHHDDMSLEVGSCLDSVSYTLRAARALISKARYAAFITIDEKGFPNACIVEPLALNHTIDEIWVGTNCHTRKITNISHNPRTAMLYFDKTTLGFTFMFGESVLTEDKQLKEENFAPKWHLFYPKGPADPRFALIRFVPQRLEVVSPLHKLAAGLNAWRPVAMTRDPATTTEAGHVPAGEWTLEPPPTEALLLKLRNGLNEDGK
jgi:general stress protein 26